MIKQIIDRAGGQAPFAKLHGIPWLTVHRWYHGHNSPPQWLVRLLDKAAFFEGRANALSDAIYQFSLERNADELIQAWAEELTPVWVDGLLGAANDKKVD